MSEPTRAVKHVESSLRDLTYILFRHKRRVIVFVVAVTALATILTMLTPKSFQSQAKILLRPGRGMLTPDPMIDKDRAMFNVRSSWESEINTELEILRSEALAHQIVREVGLAAWLGEDGAEVCEEPATPGEDGILDWVADSVEQIKSKKGPKDEVGVIKRLRANLLISALPMSNIIQVMYVDKSPDLAQKVVKTLTDCYLKHHNQIYGSPATLKFFEEETKQRQGALTKTEEALEALKLETGFADVVADRQRILARIGQISTDVDTTTAAMEEARSNTEQIALALKRIPKEVEKSSTVVPNEIVTNLQIKLRDLLVQEQLALAKYHDQSAEVTAVRRQIAEVRKQLKQEDPTRRSVTKGIDTTYDKLNGDLATAQVTLKSLQARLAISQRSLGDARGELNKLTTRENEIRTLERTRTRQETDYEKSYQDLQQAKKDEQIEKQNISNIRIVDSATYENAPVSPRAKLNIALAILVGLIGGLGIAFLSEFLDNSLSKPEDVEQRLQVPTLTSIPRLRRRRPLMPVKKETAADAGSKGGKKADAIQWEPSTQMRNYFEQIRTRLLLSGNGNGTGDRKCPVVAVTSCQAREGTSTVAANLAVMFAKERGERVLYIDATGSLRMTQRLFALKPDGETSKISVDEGTEKITVKPVKAGRLDFVLDLSEYEGSRWLPQILDTVRQKYSLIVVDTPPVLEANSGVRWTQLSDDVIVVMEAGRVRWQVAQRAKDLLDEADANVIGVVLNKRRYPVPRWLYRAL